MMDFEIEKEVGSMFIEKRSDGGIGLFVHVNNNCPSVCLPLTKDEMIKMMGWLMTYLQKQEE